MSANNLTADSRPALNEGFTQGGDITLRSTDGVDFRVLSAFLSFASPVFTELLATENRRDVVQFEGTAEVLAFMLQYIYPKPTPVVSSLELLNDALRVANKYRLESMKSRLREQLVLTTSPVSVHSAPIGTFYAVLNNGLAAEAKLAASLVREKCQPATEEGLRRLLDAAPSPTSAALVELNGIYLVKMKVLVEVLFQFEGAPMTIASDKRSLICSVCQIAMKTSSWPAPPQWQVRWARWIFGCISQRPIAIWEGFFDHSHVHTAFYQQFPLSPPTYYSQTKGFDSTTLHCSCISVVQLPGTRAAFQSWANGVYEHLRSRLAFIAELETQRHSDWPEVNN